MKTLALEPLTREGFAPFGDVIELEGARQLLINGGTTTRFHDLARIDVAAGQGQALLSLFRAQPRALPMLLTMMERHPLGSQAFVPLGAQPYVVVVAGDLDGRPHGLRAFLTQGWQGVNYARGVWHHPLLALSCVSDFVVVDRGGPGLNLQECDLAQPVCLEPPPSL